MTTTERAWTVKGISEAAYAALAQGLPASQLWTLLLNVFERRAEQRTPAAIQQQWRSDRFVLPAGVDQRTLVELDAHLLAAAQGFEAVELSPLAPLGVCSAVALTSQNRVVSAIRGTEVVSDPTNVLALESARRLRENPALTIKLATSHRCVRAQEVPRRPGFAAHFRLFALATAGLERKDRSFLADAITEHVRTHLGALDRLEQHGYEFPGRSVKMLSAPAHRPLAERIASTLDGIAVVHEQLEHGYYDGLRFMISARSSTGEDIPLIDGGAFDWLRKLASNRKLVFVASGMGSQIVPVLFRAGSR